MHRLCLVLDQQDVTLQLETKSSIESRNRISESLSTLDLRLVEQDIRKYPKQRRCVATANGSSRHDETT